MILNVGEGIGESEEDEGSKLPVLEHKFVKVALVPEHYHVIELLFNVTIVDELRLDQLAPVDDGRNAVFLLVLSFEELPFFMGSLLARGGNSLRGVGGFGFDD